MPGKDRVCLLSWASNEVNLASLYRFGTVCSLNFSSHNKGERNTLGHGSEVPSLDSHPQAAGSLEWQCKDILGDFSGGSEVKTLCSPCKGLGLIPGQGTRLHMQQLRPRAVK